MNPERKQEIYERERKMEVRAIELGDQPASWMTTDLQIAATIAAGMWASDIRTKAVILADYQCVDWDGDPSTNQVAEFVDAADTKGELTRAIASKAFDSAFMILSQKAREE